LVSTKDSPPEYKDNSSVSLLCSLTVDLKKLPLAAIAKKEGPVGEYYRVDYDLGIGFGPAGIEFKLLYE